MLCREILIKKDKKNEKLAKRNIKCSKMAVNVQNLCTD